MNEPNTTALRDRVREQVDVNWSEFERSHPHLAAAIDRTVLIDQAVRRIADDPAYRAAMDRAALDRAALDAGGRVGQVIATWVKRLLAL